MKKLSFFLLLLLNISKGYSQFGTWTALANTTDGNQGVMLLLTDGTVLCKNDDNPNPDVNAQGIYWNRLTPDIHGSYVNGTWSTTAPMNYDRLYFSSQVLPNGKVFVAGAEYSYFTNAFNTAEEYDPVANTWTLCGPIPNGWQFSDPNSELLNNGEVLTAPWVSPTFNYFNSILWSPNTLSFSNPTNTPYPDDENAGATWLKLPDNSVLYAVPFTTNSCRYFPSSNTWVNDAVLPVPLYNTIGSTGPASMLPNGNAIFFGSIGIGDNGYTAIYTPSGTNSPGTWTQGPNFPIINFAQAGASGANCAMMANGKILIAVSCDSYTYYFLEYDYISNTFSTPITSTIPIGGGFGNYTENYITTYNQIYMLDLPDGNVLVGLSGTGQYLIYTPVGGPQNSWRPTISSIREVNCDTYSINGTQFDGISEGASFGIWQMSSNYPIIRLSNGPNVYYVKTTNWTPIAAVQTGSEPCSADFTVPANVPKGTYSLSVIANGIASNPVTFVYPSLQITSATVSPNNVCVGTPITLSVTTTLTRPPYLFEWSGHGNTHVPNITIPAPANTTTYTVTVRDEYGCTASATVTYTADPNCCYIAGGVNVLANSRSSHYSNSFGVAGSTPVTIAGTFTVDNNFTIDGLTDVSMAAGAIIDVKPGAVLNITNGSRLYACGDMWQGIQVEQGGTLNIEGRAPSHFMPGIRTIVEDAIKGVEIKSTSNVNIYYSLLNNNLYDVYLDPPAEDLGIYNFHLRSSILTCEADGTYSPNAYLKSPYPGYITNSGVYMTNIGAISSSIQVGDYTSAGYQNTFSNMNYGVNATNSTFFVCNNMFEDLAGNSGYCIPLTTGACPPPIGIAVLANNTNPPYEDYESNLYYYEAIVGGTSANQGNVMLNCYRGVDITNYGFPYVVDNKITNTQDEYSMPHINAYPYGDHAIYLKDLSSPQVTGNTIQNYETGIHLSDFALVSDGPGTYTGYINNNVLDVSGRYGVMSTGILAEIALPPVGIAEPMYIEDNTVSNAGSSCITLNDVDAYLYDMYVTGNTLYILPSTSRTNNTQRSGVFVENSEDYLVYNNIIESPGTYVGTPAGAANTSVIGIRSYVSYGVYECNYINDVGECMMFEGACSPSTIYSNYFGESYNGFVLENNGVIGNQGNGTTPIGDVWQGPFYNFYTYTYNSYASDSWLYVINSSTENPATNPANDQTYCFCSGDNYVYNTNVFSATGTPLACPTNCGSCQVITPSTYRPLAEAVVQDSLPLSVFVPETQYIGQQSILEQINQNPGLMIGDSVLQNFYAAAPSTNMGTIYSINQAISSGNVTLAQSMNTALAPSNTIEQNHKSTNAIMLNTMAVHYDSLTPTQYDTLLSIALQCPLEGGKAVFHARAMLNRLLNTSILFTDSCHGMSSPPHRFHSRNTVAGLTNDIDTLSVKVYPNPANTMLNIEIGLQQGQVVNFVLYNNIGEEVENKNLNGDLTTLSLSNLPSGMYYYRIVNKNGNILKADKQLIIH